MIEDNKDKIEENTRKVDEMTKAFKAKMGSNIQEEEEESKGIDAFNVKVKSKKSKKKKSSKVKIEKSPDLPDITKTHVDTNYNEYGDYSIEKFIPDKKTEKKEDEPFDTLSPGTSRVNVREGRHTIVEMMPRADSDSDNAEGEEDRVVQDKLAENSTQSKTKSAGSDDIEIVEVPVQEAPPEESGCNKKTICISLICLIVVLGGFVATNLPIQQEDKLIRSNEDLREEDGISSSYGDL